MTRTRSFGRDETDDGRRRRVAPTGGVPVSGPEQAAVGVAGGERDLDGESEVAPGATNDRARAGGSG